MSDRNGRVNSLYRYPVKGLSAERLQTVDIGAGATFPADRMYALENGPSGFDPSAPSWQPKIKFLCLMKNAKIAELTTRYEDASGMLCVAKDGKELLRASLNDEKGRAEIEKFFQRFMDSEARGPVRVLTSPGHSFSDLSKKVISIINLESVRALEASVGRTVHPLRFRANVYIDGMPAWSEMELIGKHITIGSTKMRVVKMTKRCAATEVDPVTAKRDIAVPEELYRLIGEDDCGIYAEVTGPGQIAEGAPFIIET